MALRRSITFILGALTNPHSTGTNFQKNVASVSGNNMGSLPDLSPATTKPSEASGSK